MNQTLINKREYHKKYYKLHQKEIKARVNDYYETHREEIKARIRNYNQKHKEEIKEKHKKYYLVKSDEIKMYAKDYSKKYVQSIKGKKTHRKYNTKRRRQFGFIPLNQYFKGAHGHHIDRERVIYIPEELHNSIHHSLLNNINMEKINKIAFEFLNYGPGKGV